MTARILDYFCKPIAGQLAAMPYELYLIRFIHNQTRKAFPGERLWTSNQLTSAPICGFGAFWV